MSERSGSDAMFIASSPLVSERCGGRAGSLKAFSPQICQLQTEKRPSVFVWGSGFPGAPRWLRLACSVASL